MATFSFCLLSCPPRKVGLCTMCINGPKLSHHGPFCTPIFLCRMCTAQGSPLPLLCSIARTKPNYCRLRLHLRRRLGRLDGLRLVQRQPQQGSRAAEQIQCLAPRFSETCLSRRTLVLLATAITTPISPLSGFQITFMSSPGHVRTLKRQRSRFFGGQGCIVETQTTVEDRIPLSDNFHVEDRYVRNTMVQMREPVAGSVASNMKGHLGVYVFFSCCRRCFAVHDFCALTERSDVHRAPSWFVDSLQAK